VKPAELRREVGLRTLELRIARHWSQVQLAERARVHTTTIQRVEGGAHLSIPLLCRLATLFNVSVRDMLLPATHREPRRPGRPYRGR
jgi:transcriptional regulator with XRE-family HTH domain